MWVKITAAILAIVAVGIIGTVLVSQRKFRNRTERNVEQLLENAETSNIVFEKDDLERLPEPVKDYLDHVLEEGQRYIDTVKLKQTGEFRVGGKDDSPWKPFTATQHYSAQPPGFIWDAKIDFFPMVPVRVVDTYKKGEGSLKAKLLSTITVAEAKPGPEMNSGELLRFLSEALWFPTALLPGQGVEWEPVNETTARATIEDQGVKASALFHFSEDNEVVKIHAEERYRQEEDSFAPWTGYFENYQEKNGVLIPLEGEVGWDLSEGYLSYWKGTIEDIKYNLRQ